LLEQHSESFQFWSAIIRINTEGKSLIMKFDPGGYLLQEYDDSFVTYIRTNCFMLLLYCYLRSSINVNDKFMDIHYLVFRNKCRGDNRVWKVFIAWSRMSRSLCKRTNDSDQW